MQRFKCCAPNKGGDLVARSQGYHFVGERGCEAVGYVWPLMVATTIVFNPLTSSKR
jgi:hypothetical protein